MSSAVILIVLGIVLLVFGVNSLSTPKWWKQGEEALNIASSLFIIF